MYSKEIRPLFLVENTISYNNVKVKSAKKKIPKKTDNIRFAIFVGIESSLIKNSLPRF